MDYRVVLIRNGEFSKTLHKCKTSKTSFIHYQSIREENEGVFFPREFINSHGIKAVDYKIYVVKDIEEGDELRNLKDKMGRNYVEQPLLGKWTVLASDDYKIEETFWVCGHDPHKERMTIKDILKELVVGAHRKNYTKQIIVVHNKLVMHNEEEFSMVVCKNRDDAQRLHHTLQKAATKNRIKSLLFMGTATSASVSRLYDIILDNTDWSIEKIRRTTTRP